MCHSYCITDNFPDSVCDKKDYPLEYNGNKYSKFFYYPNPLEHFESIKSDKNYNAEYFMRNAISHLQKQSTGRLRLGI